MTLKRFRSATVREALALARAELGPTALVLSTKMVTAGGLRGWMGARVVEVTAAAGEATMSESRPEAQNKRRLTVRSTRQEVPLAEPRDLEPLTESVLSRLTAIGLDKGFASEVAGSLVTPKLRRKHLPTTAIHDAVATRLQWMTSGSEAFARVEVFVGPPGAGKTTTIAKIAAQERARKGMRLELLAADGFRVGAVEQLRLYADIIGTPFTVARTPDDVEATLRGSRTPVLVDTAGRSPNDNASAALFDVLAHQPNVRVHLVVPASTSAKQLARLIDSYAGVNPSRVILTKLDEIDHSVAPLVAVLKQRDLPVSWFGTGQRVPEDLERATPGGFAARILGESSDTRAEAAR